MFIDLVDAWKHTGKLFHTEMRPGRDFVNLYRIDPQKYPEFILGLIWSGDLDYLTVRPRYRLAGELREHEFQDDPEVARQLWPDAELDSQVYFFAPLSHTSEVHLSFELDTDHPTFEALNPDGLDEGIEEEIHVVAYTPDPEGPADATTLRLRIRPVKPMERFRGLVALDLGNTNSTLVCLDEQGQKRNGNIAVVDVELGRHAHHPRPCPTALRIREQCNGTAAGTFPKFRCDIGNRAMEFSPNGWLLLGAKRLLSDHSRDAGNGEAQKLEIYLQGEPVRLPRREPAELFVAEMFRMFYNQKVSFPEPFVITCPTTFSSYEVRQLREAVFQAWRRSRGVATTTYNSDDVERVVSQVVDEASAAGFYFLCRDFIEAPGRLPGFRYLYPRGMHLLLYDCGGGTTDISLIKAEARDHRHLRIHVLGRTGHRSFGGDNITVAVFRVLKAKLGAVLGGPAFPESPSDVEPFLQQNEKEIDRFVPTVFKPREHRQPASVNDQNVRRRRETTLLLWKWAELTKQTLANQEAAGEATGQIPTLLANEHTQLGQLLGLPKGDEKWQSIGSGQGITMDLETVNCLIDREILKTIRYANHLLRAKLPKDAEVEAVYVVGNASRYPRIKQMLTNPCDGLDIRFLDSRLARVDPEDLKNSVAKGALRALQLRQGMLGITVRFDERLMDRLPYSITHHDLGRIRDTVLFPENKLYEQLGLQEITVPENNPARQVLLDRMWPGDRTASPFLDFEFPRPVSGRLLVYYDKDRRRFQMREKDDLTEPVDGRPQVGTVDCDAPAQSGDL